MVVALGFEGDEISGRGLVTCGNVVVGEATLTAGVEELAWRFCTRRVGVKPAAWFLVWRDVVGGLQVALALGNIGGGRLLASKSIVRLLLGTGRLIMLLLSLLLGKRLGYSSSDLTRQVLRLILLFLSARAGIVTGSLAVIALD